MLEDWRSFSELRGSSSGLCAYRLIWAVTSSIDGLCFYFRKMASLNCRIRFRKLIVFRSKTSYISFSLHREVLI